MKIGFIGLGNMAQAMIGGMLKKKIAEPGDIIGSDLMEITRKQLADSCGIDVVLDNCMVAEQSDILILAIKPQFYEIVIHEIRDHVKKNTLIISIAAGKTIAFIEEHFCGERKIIRCMPNTPALVGEGCTGVSRNGNVLEEEMALCMKMIESFGIAEEVPEHLIDAVVGVSGSSPAYVFLFLEALADGAVAAGMPRQQAYRFAAQAVMGSAKLMLETGKHPGELKDMVCSPGGTTMEAVKILEEKGFRSAVIAATEAAIKKSKQL